MAEKLKSVEQSNTGQEKLSWRDKLNLIKSVVNSVMTSRNALATKLGQQFDGNRLIYNECGYPLNPQFQEYYSRYTRQDIARRIVNAYPDATWRDAPDVFDDENEDVETPFEKEWKALVKRVRLFHHFRRLDRITGIGHYGVLFLGFDDGENLDQPVKPGKRKLLYVQPFMEENAAISTWVTDRNSERYGEPEIYNLRVRTINNQSNSTSVAVHWTRVLHVAENLLESNVFGTPRLEPVLNRLIDLEKLCGGSAEMFWKGGFPGLQLNIEADAEVKPEVLSTMREDLENYSHSLQRFLRTQGMKIEQLHPFVADPRSHVDIQVEMISADTGIPKRILLGSERGELASTQDKENWKDRVEERKSGFAEDVILRPFIERMVMYGVLPTIGVDKLIIEWPELGGMSSLERAELGVKRMEALSKYVGAPGADMIYPVDQFLSREMELTTEEIIQITTQMEEAIEEEEKEREEAEKFGQEDGNEDEELEER